MNVKYFNMIDLFSRLRLLIGKEQLKTIQSKRILVFGLGGVGGNVCDALVRSGIEDISIVDNDIINVTNINRQLIANYNTVGKKKVDVMEEHLKSLNPNVKVTKFDCFYLPDNSEQFDFSKYDYVIDAIDTVSAKIDIIFKCKTQHVRVISALGCGNKMDPTKLEVSDIYKTEYDPLARVLRRELKKRCIDSLKVVYSKEKPLPLIEEEKEEKNNKKEIPGSTAFVPPVAGIIIASEVIKDLLDK